MTEKESTTLVCNITPQDEFRIAPEEIRGSVEVLKEGRMFMNTLPGGEIPCLDLSGLGLFYADTRYMSCLEIRLNGTEPVFLSRTLRDSHFSQVELTNKEFSVGGQTVPLQSVHFRLIRLVKDGYFQRMRIMNFNQCPLDLELKIKIGADFADIFEVRGTNRSSRGTLEKPVLGKEESSISYIGKDKLRRTTLLEYDPEPAEVYEEEGYIYLTYKMHLEPKEKYYFFMKVTPKVGSLPDEGHLHRDDVGFARVSKFLTEAYQSWQGECLQIVSDNERFNHMVKVAITDLRALSAYYPGAGTVLEAGIPWYAAPFGRDALITAWQSLPVNPDLAEETLRFMAQFQGRTVDTWRDEEPGKIMHEMRFGEMARAGEIPHTPYYGSVDSTPWFIILLAEYIIWTGDDDFLMEMWDPLKKALAWCEEYGDTDRDGYIEYLCRSEKGLVNQGWKDSWDGVIDREGRIPEGPIALVEVQAYYYRALTGAADLFEYQGELPRARELRLKAKNLKKKFLHDFWIENDSFVGFALDGKKKLLDTVVSNPGHCLFTGILPEREARLVAARLMQSDMFSGWGIRTMAYHETAYNPMSYHNGSIWPHDNAIIGYGMRKAGELGLLKKITETLFDATEYFDHARLPELFCGFTREGHEGPVKYPIACDPQAWAVGSIFLLLRALLGIECSGSEIYIRNPQLPGFMKTLRLENLRAGSGRVALEFASRQDKTYCGVIGAEGDVKVIFG